jgi:hypothetical protein
VLLKVGNLYFSQILELPGHYYCTFILATFFLSAPSENLITWY